MSEENKVKGEGQQEKRPVLEAATTLTGKRKKNRPFVKWLVAILCVVVVCAVGYWAALEFKPEEVIVEPTEVPNYTTRLIESSADKVKSVTVTYDGDKYTVLNNGDGTYALEGLPDFGLDQTIARNMIARGSTLTSQATAALNCQDLAAYGLDKPTAIMDVQFTDGTTASIELGNKSPLSYYYVKMGGSNDVYTVFSSVATTLMTDLEALHTVALPGALTADYINYVKLERPESSPVVPGDFDQPSSGSLLTDMMSSDVMLGTTGFEAGGAGAAGTAATEAPAAEPTAEPTAEPVADEAEEPFAEDVVADVVEPKMTVIELRTRGEGEASLGTAAYKLVQPFEYDADSEAVTNLATNIAAITISEYVGNVSEPGNPYGMENPIRLTAKDANDVEITFQIGNKADETNTYICVDDTGDVYLTPTASIEFAKNLTVAGVVDRFANIINITKVDSLDVTTPDGQYELKIERIPEYDEEGNPALDDKGKEIVNEVYYFNGSETGEKAFKKLYQEVIGILVNGVTDDYDIEGEPVITVTYHLNVEPGELTIEYIDYDRDRYAVRRDGHTYFHVRKSIVNTMQTALSSYEP